MCTKRAFRLRYTGLLLQHEAINSEPLKENHVAPLERLKRDYLENNEQFEDLIRRRQAVQLFINAWLKIDREQQKEVIAYLETL